MLEPAKNSACEGLVGQEHREQVVGCERGGGGG